MLRLTYSRAHGSRNLPQGVVCRPLDVHADDRGAFVEIFRNAWDVAADKPVQWNLLETQAGVLRGVRLHPLHDDCQVFFVGRVCLGLCDLRPDSATQGLGLTLEIEQPCLVSVPRGIAHGVYYRERAFQAVGVSRYYDGDDELRVRWDDPDLGIPWPELQPTLSPEDQTAGSYGALVERYEAAIGSPAVQHRPR